MMQMFAYTAEDDELQSVIESNNMEWGKGARVEVFNRDGNPRYLFQVFCHPDFEGFDRYQSMTDLQFREAVIERLNAGAFAESINKVKDTGFEVMIRINGTDAS